MPVTVVTTPNGYLQYRLRSHAIPGYYAKESTGIKNTRANRDQKRQLEAHAALMSAEMKAGRFDYLSWFPNGSKAAHFRALAESMTVGEFAPGWLQRRQPPLVRAGTARTYAKHVRCHILPRFASVRLSSVTTAALDDFRASLIVGEEKGGKGLSLKTARDVIDATFRALYRDARTAGLAGGDPFAALKWPRNTIPEPDPFEPDERVTLLDYFARKDRFWHPFVFTQFWTGMRPSEAIGLRRGSIDVKRGKLSVVVSRTYDEDNAPKTARSRRTITLLPDVVRVLREMPRSVLPKPADFVFTTPEGHAVDVDRFVDQHWHRALSATSIRPRPFYNCRHTFISSALTRGAKTKWIAEYVGTSLEMIEKHYGRWMGGDEHQLALLAGEGASDPVNGPISDRSSSSGIVHDDQNRSVGPISGPSEGKSGIFRDRRRNRKTAQNPEEKPRLTRVSGSKTAPV